ncbi:MAG: lipocalin-like domain-containing protein [Candidatus Acidiferrales bacterium]
MGNERLVGTWKLEAALSTSSTGERDETPYGLKPSGFLTYGDDGRMTALISYGGRKPLSPMASATEQAEAFKTFFAYAGGYTLTGTQVVHHVEISSIHNYVNRDLVRTVRFEGDCIVLVTPPSIVNGKIQTVELTWHRLTSKS